MKSEIRRVVAASLLAKKQDAPELQSTFDKLAGRTRKVLNLFATVVRRPSIVKRNSSLSTRRL